MTAVRNLPALVFAMVLIAASAASAQAVFSGVVLDPNGDPVEGATIYLTNITTKSQLDFVTPANGRFEFSGLPAGEYRVTSMGAPILPFNVTLPAGEPVRQDITLAFGPFSSNWQIVPSNPAPGAPAAGRGQPANFRCAERGLPLCGPESLVAEFERDELERLKSPVLAPRMVRPMPDQRYPASLVESRLEGDVTLETRIGVDGSLIGLRVVSSGHPALAEAALASAMSGTWEPARIRGTAVEVTMTINVQFRLQPAFPARGGTIPQSIALQVVAPAIQLPPAAATNPAFEAASVKPNNSGAPMVSMRTQPGGRFTAINQTLRGLIQFAYGVRAFQLVGPSWIDEARFDVTATAGRETIPGEIQIMLRSLLADRFKLVVRTETRDSQIYALVATRGDGRLGSQIRPAVTGACTPAVPGQPIATAPGQLQPCGTLGGGRGGPLTGRAITLDQLATNLSNQVDRPVLNRTGMTGTFDLELEFAGGRGGGGLGPLPPQPGEAPPPPDDRPVLTTAIQEQLGLRLDNARGQLAITVVESVSQPTPD